jgi:acetylornithine deacetylase/succinyl-diaminopimelate desuccinylase-like protein
MFDQIPEEFKDVIKRIDSLEVIKIIQDLVRIPSENPPGKEKEIALYVDEFMRLTQ